MLSKSLFGYRLLRGMDKKSIFFVVFLLIMPVYGWASPTSSQQAQAVVQNWLSQDRTPMGVRFGQSQEMAAAADTTSSSDTPTLSLPEIKAVQPYYHDGIVLYYIVSFEPEGFAIVAGDDLIEPIIGFQAKGEYDPSAENPLGAMVTQDLTGRVLDARATEEKLSANAEQVATNDIHRIAQRKWQTLEQSSSENATQEEVLSTISDIRVSPLVQSTWNQDLVGSSACYNYYTPPDSAGSSSNYVCGCVATAMAQLMRFWSYPTSGVGTGSYVVYIDYSKTTRNLRGGNGAGGVYNWSSMPLKPGSTITTAQRQAIGALTADAGVAVNMSYTYFGSGADTLAAASAFVDTFKFSNAKNGYSGSSSYSIPADNRNNMLNPNLDAGYPTLLGITGTDGGHAIVCDGYGYNSATLYHHLNMGWSGLDNGWYNLPTVDTSWTTFDVHYKTVYNVYTTGSGEIISGRISDSNGSAIAGATVIASGGGKSYTVTTNTKGIFAFAKVASNTSFTITPSKSGYAFSPASKSVTTAASINQSTITGNKWGTNFTGAASTSRTSIDVAPISILLLQ